MSSEILERDANGKPTVIVFREDAAERLERQAARKEQTERGRAVAASIRASIRQRRCPYCGKFS